MFVDGQEKTTRLPPIEKDSIVTFDTELLQRGRARVTVEVSDKIVTFDWMLEEKGEESGGAVGGGLSGGDGEEKAKGLFVLCKIAGEGWKFNVE